MTAINISNFVFGIMNDLQLGESVKEQVKDLATSKYTQSGRKQQYMRILHQVNQKRKSNIRESKKWIKRLQA